MNKKAIFISLSILLFLTGGCTSDKNKEETSIVSSKNNLLIDSTTEKLEDTAATSESEQSINESSNSSTIESSDRIADTNDNKVSLSEYTNKQIEYARVWLTVMENNRTNPEYQGIDELNITNIPAGTPLNPNDDTSAVYSVDVIQLAGSRLIDGSVTYKSNEDGTITVYDVPLRWEASIPEDVDKDNVSHYTQKIIDEAYIINVETGNIEEVQALIEMETIH